MARHGAVTFKGAPLTLVGEEVAVGASAPDFDLMYYKDGMHHVPQILMEFQEARILHSAGI